MEIEKILRDTPSLYKIIVYMYLLQTPQEQGVHQTIESNGVGFNAFDAEIMSSFAKQILAGKRLSDKQLLSATMRLPKYRGQLENGLWEGVMLPEPVQVLPTHKGRLEIDSSGRMAFYPNVYPSKQIKSLGFSTFTGGAWRQTRASINQQVVEDIIKMFGDIDVDQSVTDAMNKPDIEIPTEIKDHSVLKPHQKDAIEFALKYKHTMISLAPRLGKTSTAIFAAKASGCKRILVIAPLSLLYHWRREIKKWVGESSVIWYQKMLPIKDKWTITNYDTVRMRPEQFKENWDAIIIDESILIKNRHTARTKAVKEVVKSSKAEYVMELSGAPISKLLDDMWAQVNILDPNRFSSYWRFVERYCHIESNQWSSYNIIANKQGAEEQMKKDLSDIYFSRTQDQVLDLPEWDIDDVHIPMGKYQDKMYGQMEDEFMAELGNDEHLLAPNVLSQMIRLIQIASNPLLIGGKDNSAKWDAVEEMIQYENGPFVIWTCFIQTAEHMLERLSKKYRTAILTGRVKDKDRQGNVDKFQNGELDVLIAHPAVGKFGFNMTTARTSIYLERRHNGDDYYQSLYRIRGMETSNRPRIIHMLSDRYEGTGDTVDAVVGKILQTRKDSVLSLTTGDLKNLFMEVRNG